MRGRTEGEDPPFAAGAGEVPPLGLEPPHPMICRRGGGRREEEGAITGNFGQ